MKRSDLYEKVWSVPMTRLAAELGISDVGLAKACRRHSIPVPPRGHWAKLKAGQHPQRIPLPAPELDVAVQLATRDPEEVARQRVEEERRNAVLRERATLVQDLPPLAFATDLERAHPLVKATQRYCDQLPRLIETWKHRGWHSGKPGEPPPTEQHGRYSLVRKGCLDINAALESMDWILRFHATVLGGLTAGAMKIVRREGEAAAHAGQSPTAPVVEMHFKGEVLAIRFSEGHRRVRLSPKEFAARRKERSWASEYEMRPSGNFTFTISGTERGASREWKGTSEKLQGQVDEIVRTAFQLACLQPQLRREWKAREMERQEAAALEARKQEQREARAEQLKQAFLVMDADARVSQLQAFLDRMEERASGLREPLNERAVVWVRVVREELSRRNPADELLERCLTVPSWRTWPPAWWPEELDPGNDSSDD